MKRQAINNVTANASKVHRSYADFSRGRLQTNFV